MILLATWKKNISALDNPTRDDIAQIQPTSYLQVNFVCIHVFI